MNMTMTKTLLTTLLATLSATLCATTAQAAAGYLLGTGGQELNRALTPTGSLSHLWSASASLDTTLSPASAAFQAGSASVLGTAAAGRIDGSGNTTVLLLEADLAIVATGEAVGSAVRLTVIGTADSLFASSGPGVQALPTVDLVVRDAGSNILGSWQGLPAGHSADFSLSVDSQVGQRLSFSLSHHSSLLADGFDLGAGPGATLDMAALLNGSISVSAVPEPETGALLLAGLAAIGLLHRRGRRAA